LYNVYGFKPDQNVYTVPTYYTAIHQAMQYTLSLALTFDLLHLKLAPISPALGNVDTFVGFSMPFSSSIHDRWAQSVMCV